jgi:DNA (cytosine-5)-methyltransferase 1
MNFIMNTDIYSLLHNIYREAQNDTLPLSDLRKLKGEITIAAQRAMGLWTPQDNKNDQTYIFQYFDFFSGCGGMSLGFHAISQIAPFFKSIGGCDIDPDAAHTYERNIDAPGIVADIRGLNEPGKIEKFLSMYTNYDKNKPLIVIGCPPCQGFTTHRKQRWNKEEDDERNSLVGIFASIAVRIKPICIIMENVPEMLSNKYWAHYKEARDTFIKAGYTIHQTIYNAASFGVPQERFRTILIAMRHEFLLPQPLISNSSDFITVRQTIGDLPLANPGQPNPNDPFHRSANHKINTINTIKAVPKDGGNRPFGVGPKCLDRIKGFSDVYGRLYWDRPAITLTHYARNPASGRFIHPEQDRGLTMREAALLQSFPIGFEFTGTFDSIFKQIGEAVPPRFACGVATSVLVELLSDIPSKEELDKGIKSIIEPVSNSYSSVIAGIKAGNRRGA